MTLQHTTEEILNNEDTQYYPTSNRNVKDRLFRFIFQDKKDLLDLYNAVNQSDYTNIDDFEVNTLDDAIYLSMKNDISFLIGGTMNLYEHQSSYNPNMPMRGLLYFAKLYEGYIHSHEINLFRNSLQHFPAPQYIIFYNGLTEEPDASVLKLSDAFLENTGITSCLECTALMLNINYGHNQVLMKKCRRLEEYSIFIHTIRKYQKIYDNIHKAVSSAVDDCIENNILKDILNKHKSEVISMVLTTFDQALYERDIRADGYEDGFNDGLSQSIQFVIKTLQESSISKEKILSKLIENFPSIDSQTLEKYVNEFWK